MDKCISDIIEFGDIQVANFYLTGSYEEALARFKEILYDYEFNIDKIINLNKHIETITKKFTWLHRPTYLMLGLLHNNQPFLCGCHEEVQEHINV